jgi:RodZ C-terminal domain
VYAKGFIRSYAGYLGLDPTPLVDAYRSQEGPEAPVFERAPRALTGGLGVERRRRGRSSWLLVGIVCVSIVLVASVWSLLKPPRSNQTALTATPPATAPPTTTPPEPTTTTQPKPRGVTLVLHYSGASWTRVAVDGKVSFRGIGAASDRRTFKAKREIEITLGAPGEVRLTVNGRSIVPTNNGRIWHRLFTLDSLKKQASNGPSDQSTSTSGNSGGSTGTGVTTSTRSSLG